MFIVRWILGRIILILDFVFSPKKRQRTEEQQINVDNQTKELALFQYAACPFCVKVRREMRRQNLPIKIVDAKQADNKQNLLNEGGKVQVPCLRIEKDGQFEWLYESKAIVTYLNDRFA